jgi:hypothetical protein
MIPQRTIETRSLEIDYTIGTVLGAGAGTGGDNVTMAGICLRLDCGVRAEPRLFGGLALSSS